VQIKDTPTQHNTIIAYGVCLLLLAVPKVENVVKCRHIKHNVRLSIMQQLVHVPSWHPVVEKGQLTNSVAADCACRKPL
jgi:hypothetical protein